MATADKEGIHGFCFFTGERIETPLEEMSTANKTIHSCKIKISLLSGNKMTDEIQVTAGNTLSIAGYVQLPTKALSRRLKQAYDPFAY